MCELTGNTNSPFVLYEALYLQAFISRTLKRGFYRGSAIYGYDALPSCMQEGRSISTRMFVYLKTFEDCAVACTQSCKYSVKLRYKKCQGTGK